MSSWPGPALEDFLMWQLDLIVDGDGGANPSLQIAEALGTITRRRHLTSEQFSPIVALFEAHRQDTERRLGDFDEETQSWRTYGGTAFDFIPEERYAQARKMIAEIP